jgi:predicted metal-dependent RNase
LSGKKKIAIPWEERGPEGFRRELRETEIHLEVEQIRGFSSHARGQQILEWLGQFKSVGEVLVVHGEEDKAVGLAEAIRKMGIPATAPKRGETVAAGRERVRPGPVPPVPGRQPAPEWNPVDR